MRPGGRIIAGVVGAIGLTVLAGWYGGLRSLLTLIPEHGTVKPNTALGLLIVALGVLALGSALSRRATVIVAAGAAAFLIGALTLAEMIFGLFAGIDVILPGIDLRGDTPQMAPATAASLVVLGGALLGSLRTKPTLTLGFAFAALAVSEIAVLGYVYGVSSLYTVGGATSIALPTALCVMGLACAILLQFPTHGIVGLARDHGSAGRLLRPVLPVIILGPFLLGLGLLSAEQMGWFDATFAVALLVLIMSALGSVVGGMASRRLRTLDRLQSEANTALFTSNQTLEGTVTERTKELAGTAASLHALIRAAPVGIVQFDTAGAVTSTNDRWRELSGLTDSETRSTDWWSTLLHPDDIERVRGAWADCLAGQGPFEATLRFCLPDGSVNWVKVRTAPLVRDGVPAGHLASVTDVTALRAAEANALEARELFEAAFASSPLGTAIVSNDGIVIEANQRLGELSGLQDSQMRHRSIDSLFHPVEGSDSSANSALGVLMSTRQRLDRRMKRIDGIETWVKVTVAEISGRNTGSLLYQLEDITARRLAESRVEHLAFHDPLTNLPNRLLLLDRLRQALVHATRHGSGVGVLFLDLDGFKAVNDTQGHQAGDTVLIEVAARIRLGARGSDTVSRIGGDEFVVVCPDITDMSDVVRIATGLQAAIAQPISIGEKLVSVGSSLGIACGVGHEDPESLLHDADQAMYLAKGRGRARYEVFDDDLRGRIDRRQDTEVALRTAVERGEIEAWYQPIVDLETLQIVACEAGPRWRRPLHGVVFPAELIPIAEETGLIRGIGGEVLVRACQAAADSQNGPSVTVHVSPRQFVHEDFGAVVKHALRASGLSPDRLWLELTESGVTEAVHSAARTFQELREMGVRLAIGNFGSGFSSFGQLRALSVDTVKIDMTFINDLAESPRDRAIVEATIRLGQAMDLNVVAEGITTEFQRQFLLGRGCRYGQGDLFAAPQATVPPAVACLVLEALDPTPGLHTCVHPHHADEPPAGGESLTHVTAFACRHGREESVAYSISAGSAGESPQARPHPPGGTGR